ncbi:transglycosylase-like protein with SLT domain [Providencia alcalifaciens]|uniref:Transglycosylase-like protein with SLT domain n=2 Tax=Morganellaceae TaxID=1903414 RepID=A0A4R3NJC4_9GAMM|nr:MULTISPECIES: transglycosylase SLT domain-containing protein [Providencia]MBC5792322.1 transglycosylase SLT domain-containing protein [Providencia sp. JUb39]TCT28903.1 transglycosylase-like protein with SLT domain [Providencia alcalifaciens]
MRIIFILIALFVSPFSFSYDCYDKAGNDYKIDPDLLRAVAFRESSFNPNAINQASSTRYAIGLMQIHSQNFGELAQYGITENHLKQDPCMNIYTGAFYLAKFIRIQGDVWKGVGAYNAGLKKSIEQEQKRNQYALEIYHIYLKIKENKST